MDPKFLTTCPEHGPKSGAFCNDCGKALESKRVGPDLAGVWRVTTEGDCEGRTTKDLGTWKGTIAEVARRLAPQAYYALRFEAATDPGAARDMTHGKVSVSACGVGMTVEW